MILQKFWLSVFLYFLALIKVFSQSSFLGAAALTFPHPVSSLSQLCTDFLSEVGQHGLEFLLSYVNVLLFTWLVLSYHERLIGWKLMLFWLVLSVQNSHRTSVVTPVWSVDSRRRLPPNRKEPLNVMRLIYRWPFPRITANHGNCSIPRDMSWRVRTAGICSRSKYPP